MPKRKWSNTIGLFDIWSIQGLIEYVASFLISKNTLKSNLAIFGIFYQLCKKSRQWSQIHFVDKLCPIIRDQFDMFFWKRCLPNLQELLIGSNNVAFIIQFDSLQNLYFESSRELLIHELKMWTCYSLKKLYIDCVSISQQTLSLISQKLIHLRELQISSIHQTNINISNFPELDTLELTCGRKQTVYLKNLPMFQHFEYSSYIRCLQIENVPKLKCIKGRGDITTVMLCSSVPKLESLDFGHANTIIENIHFINIQNIISLTCCFQVNMKQICDYTKNMKSLCLLEMNSFFDIPWDQYQKLEKLDLKFPSLGSIEHLFCFKLPFLRKLRIMWTIATMDFASFSQFPNLQTIDICAPHADYVNFPFLFQLKHLKSVRVGMELRYDDKQLLGKNAQPCSRCIFNMVIMTSKPCVLCKLFLCCTCVKKYHGCYNQIN